MRKLRIFIPKGSKACSDHNQLGAWENAQFIHNLYKFNKNQIEDAIELLCSPVESTSFLSGCFFLCFDSISFATIVIIS